MAKVKKSSFLTADEFDKLSKILNRYSTGAAAGFFEALDSGKEFPSGVLSADQISDIQPIISKLPANRRDVLTQYLGGSENILKESGLTDEELQTRLEGYQELGETKTPSQFDKDKYEDFIAQQIANKVRENFSVSNSSDFYKSIAKKYSDDIRQGKDVTQSLTEDIFSRASIGGREGNVFNGSERASNFESLKQVSKDIQGFVREHGGSFNRPEQLTDTSTDISRVQDILSTRGKTREKEGVIEDYLTALPQELSASREEFLGGEESRAFDELSRQVPIVRQNLNAQGLLFSGDVGDVLSSQTLDIQSQLDAVRAQTEAEDSQFYYDAAYRNAIRKELQSTEDYRTAIGTERGRILSERESKFRSYQSDIDRQLDEQLKRSDYERQLAANRIRLSNTRREQEDQRRVNTISNIGSTGANIAITKGLSSGYKAPEVPARIGG